MGLGLGVQLLSIGRIITFVVLAIDQIAEESISLFN